MGITSSFVLVLLDQPFENGADQFVGRLVLNDHNPGSGPSSGESVPTPSLGKAASAGAENSDGSPFAANSAESP